jgi:hypothetical protein
VNLGPAGLAFVLAVIEIGPLAGLVWMRTNRRSGARLIALTMMGSLLFGLINHFIIPGTDRVDLRARPFTHTVRNAGGSPGNHRGCGCGSGNHIRLEITVIQ